MAASEYDRALQRLRHNHVRLTPQRKTILRYLISHHTHPTVEMTYNDLKDQVDNISLATIYNTLKVLVDYHIVIELKTGDGSSHYDYFGHPHYHVVCDNCGKITDVFDKKFSDFSQQLEQITRDQTGYLVTESNVEVHGICPDCQYKLGLKK
ncbi:Fur family transcriptional regulator [Limosilactobacillus difficilis]|uniref:Fur family transcriptional regulator n=1 Tax=Limosilactobacillus difficilis TaxID=2991838 RepID=UPI0024BAE802|nr:Fur family transcriptional regulator [Limosilactobacillus difficilis]